ncbi:MAG: hypothetical protein ABJN40_07355 [Sneathiella sp.]
MSEYESFENILSQFVGTNSDRAVKFCEAIGSAFQQSVKPKYRDTSLKVALDNTTKVKIESTLSRKIKVYCDEEYQPTKPIKPAYALFYLAIVDIKYGEALVLIEKNLQENFKIKTKEKLYEALKVSKDAIREKHVPPSDHSNENEDQKNQSLTQKTKQTFARLELHKDLSILPTHLMRDTTHFSRYIENSFDADKFNSYDASFNTVSDQPECNIRNCEEKLAKLTSISFNQVTDPDTQLEPNFDLFFDRLQTSIDEMSFLMGVHEVYCKITGKGVSITKRYDPEAESGPKTIHLTQNDNWRITGPVDRLGWLVGNVLSGSPICFGEKDPKAAQELQITVYAHQNDFSVAPLLANKEDNSAEESNSQAIVNRLLKTFILKERNLHDHAIRLCQAVITW